MFKADGGLDQLSLDNHSSFTMQERCKYYFTINGWRICDLRLFSTVFSPIRTAWVCDNKMVRALGPRLRFRRFPPRDSNPGPIDQQARAYITGIPRILSCTHFLQLLSFY